MSEMIHLTEQQIDVAIELLEAEAIEVSGKNFRSLEYQIVANALRRIKANGVGDMIVLTKEQWEAR